VPRVKYAMDYCPKNSFSMNYVSRKVIFPVVCTLTWYCISGCISVIVYISAMVYLPLCLLCCISAAVSAAVYPLLLIWCWYPLLGIRHWYLLLFIRHWYPLLCICRCVSSAVDLLLFICHCVSLYIPKKFEVRWRW